MPPLPRPVFCACCSRNFSPLFAASWLLLLHLSTGLSVLPHSICIFCSSPLSLTLLLKDGGLGGPHVVRATLTESSVTQVIPEAAGQPTELCVHWCPASDARHPSVLSCGPENGPLI